MRRSLSPVLALVLLLPACHGRAREPASTPAPPSTAAQRPASDGATVEVKTAAGNTLRVQVEVARTEQERARGLMFRRSLAPDAGMLFAMPADDDWAFWMKNTLIPLDLIYADRDGVVVGVIEDARPLDEASRRVGKPSRYVLEVNGGWCRKHGVGAGARLTLPQ